MAYENGGIPADRARSILEEVKALRQDTLIRVDKIESILQAQGSAMSQISAKVEAHGENIDLLFQMLRRIAKEKGVPKNRGIAVPKEDFYREAEEHGIGRRQALQELSRADVIIRSAGKNTVVCKLDGRAVRVILTKGELPCRG